MRARPLVELPRSAGPLARRALSGPAGPDRRGLVRHGRFPRPGHLRLAVQRLGPEQLPHGPRRRPTCRRSSARSRSRLLTTLLCLADRLSGGLRDRALRRSRAPPARRRCSILPWFVDYLIRVYAWIVLLGDNGVVNGWLGDLGHEGRSARAVPGHVVGRRRRPLLQLLPVHGAADLRRRRAHGLLARRGGQGSLRHALADVPATSRSRRRSRASWPAPCSCSCRPSGDFANSEFLGSPEHVDDRQRHQRARSTRAATSRSAGRSPSASWWALPRSWCSTCARPRGPRARARCERRRRSKASTHRGARGSTARASSGRCTS